MIGKLIMILFLLWDDYHMFITKQFFLSTMSDLLFIIISLQIGVSNIWTHEAFVSFAGFFFNFYIFV